MENNNKPMTAVEWLELEYKKQGFLYDLDVEAAKQMEKKQIENAYWDGGQDVPCHGDRCQEYYNETYGSQAPQRLEEADGKIK